jgi:hypothetical protein
MSTFNVKRYGTLQGKIGVKEIHHNYSLARVHNVSQQRSSFMRDIQYIRMRTPRPPNFTPYTLRARNNSMVIIAHFMRLSALASSSTLDPSACFSDNYL